MRNLRNSFQITSVNKQYRGWRFRSGICVCFFDEFLALVSLSPCSFSRIERFFTFSNPNQERWEVTTDQKIGIDRTKFHVDSISNRIFRIVQRSNVQIEGYCLLSQNILLGNWGILTVFIVGKLIEIEYLGSDSIVFYWLTQSQLHIQIICNLDTKLTGKNGTLDETKV
jgi:hypothetical protein